MEWRSDTHSPKARRGCNRRVSESKSQDLDGNTAVGRAANTTILTVYCGCRINFVEGYGLHDAIECLSRGVLGSPSFSHEQNKMGSLGPLSFVEGVLSRLLRQAGPVFAQVTPHRDHFVSFSFSPPLPGDGLPLTHSPRMEVVSGSVTRRVPPRLLGVLLWQFGNGLFGLPAPGSEGAPSRFH